MGDCEVINLIQGEVVTGAPAVSAQGKGQPAAPAIAEHNSVLI